MSPRERPWWRGLGPGDEMAPAELDGYGDEGEDDESGGRAVLPPEKYLRFLATCDCCGAEVDAFALDETAGFCLICDDFRRITGVREVTS